MTKQEFDQKLALFHDSQPNSEKLLIDEKTAFEVFGKGNYKHLYTYKGFRVTISTHLPDDTILLR